MPDTCLIYGATGYTGGLIVREAIAQGMQPILGGRTEATLSKTASAFGLPYRTFDLRDHDRITHALDGVDVLLNCAGPFVRTAPVLIDGGLRTGTHYLDLAGEVPAFEAVASRDAEAQRAGIVLLPGAGFGVVPSDCLAAYLQARLPSATTLTLALDTTGGVSRGTLGTLLVDLLTEGVVRQDGVLQPAAPAAHRHTIDFGQGPKTAVTNPWRGDLVTAHYSTGIPNIETFQAFPAPLRGLMAASQWLGGLWRSGFVQRLLGWLARRLPAGPTDEALEAGSTRIWGKVTDAEGRAVAARLKGPEAYLFTARTAVALLKRVAGGEEVPAGFHTPATAFGADLVLDIQGVERIDDYTDRAAHVNVAG